MGYRLFLCLWDFPIFGCILAVSLDGLSHPGQNECILAPSKRLIGTVQHNTEVVRLVVLSCLYAKYGDADNLSAKNVEKFLPI